MNINLFGNDKFEQLQKKNKKDIRTITRADREIVESVCKKLSQKDINIAYIEVTKQDMITMAMKPKRGKKTFLDTLGGSEEKFVDDVLDVAPKITHLSRFVHVFKDSMGRFMTYIAILALLLYRPPALEFGYADIAVMATSLVTILSINLIWGKMALIPSNRTKDPYTLEIFSLLTFGAASYVVRYYLPAQFSVNTWTPVAFVALTWFLSIALSNILDNKDLKFIEKNYE